MILIVEDRLAIRFRDPRRPGILIASWSSSIGSIVLMGAPMLHSNKRL